MLGEFDFVVLSKIFSYLKLYDRFTISYLNKKLHNSITSTAGLLIHNLIIRNNFLKIKKYFCKYKALANGITEIDVTENSNIDLSIFTRVRKLKLWHGISKCNLADITHLERLELYGPNVFKLERIYDILKKCSKGLTTIKLHSQVNVNSEILHFIVDNFPDLICLDVSWCSQILPADFSLLREKCTKLESLAIFCCESIYEADYNYFKYHLKYFDHDLVEIIHKRVKI